MQAQTQSNKSKSRNQGSDVRLANPSERRFFAQMYAQERDSASSSCISPRTLRHCKALGDTGGQSLGLAVGRAVALDLPVRLLSSSIVPELGDVLLNSRVKSGLQLRPIAEHEEDLEPDEEGSEEEGLDHVVEEGGGTTLEDSMADELRDPGEDVDTDGDVVGGHAIVGG